MKKILVFGAGRSAYYTIHYLLENAARKNWQVTVADALEENIRACTTDFPSAHTEIADVHKDDERRTLIGSHDIIISLLPARFHYIVAEDCVYFKKHLITPSYISPELQSLDKLAKESKLVFLNELGLDPGIDHMSAMKIKHTLEDDGAHISSFRSYCGGLIASENDDNPWHYKFSWNPYNVVRAGQEGGIALMKGGLKYQPYNRLFRETELIHIEGAGTFEAYLNRNSLRYISLYGLENVETFVRGTLRYPGFCRLWNFMVKSGLTNDLLIIENLDKMSWRQLFDIFMPSGDQTLSEKFAQVTGNPAKTEDIAALEWLEILSDEKLSLKNATPAMALQVLLERKWAMQQNDKDRVVMVHEFVYTKNNETNILQSWMDINGEDLHKTAMAKTVGLPLALAAELIADEKIHAYGVILPTIKEVYEPVLAALEAYGITFKENIMKLGQVF